jgi:hypothetical protein
MPLVGIGARPTPFAPASGPLPPETGGRGPTSLRLGGWGESQFRRGTYTVVLFICTYFVILPLPHPLPPSPLTNFSLFLSLPVCRQVELILTGEGVGEEPNLMTSRKPGPLQTIQYSLGLPLDVGY